MSLHIRAVRDKGLFEKERLVLSSDSDEDIGQYIVFNTTMTDEESVSANVKNTLWLPDHRVGAGDLVVVYTKSSKSSVKEKENSDGTKTIFIYWGMDSAVWNRGSDSAVLIKIDDWEWKKI